jgi:hypothetical protein
MVVAVTLGSLLPVDPDAADDAPEILRAIAVYVVWGISATAVFVFTWRRLRST